MEYILITIKHKWFVLLAGLKLHIPLWLLLIHDWSKFTLKELPHYQRQFYGKADKPLDFSYAWLHHQKYNKHHWEYWIPITGHNRGGYVDMQPLPMPVIYVKEMIADWIGAGRAYEGKYPDINNWVWWQKHNNKILAHCAPETIKIINAIIPKQEME